MPSYREAGSGSWCAGQCVWDAYVLCVVTFCSPSACCRILRLSLLSMYIIDGEIAGRVAQSCLSSSFLLKSHVTVGQKLFSLLEVRGR